MSLELESQFILDAKTLTKRELMSKYHPDRYIDAGEKKTAEKLFKLIGNEKPSHTYTPTRSYSYCSTPATGWWTVGDDFFTKAWKASQTPIDPNLDDWVGRS
jgi:hypothetical protein